MRIRFNEEGRKALVPESEVVFPLDYCLTCIAESAIKNTGFPQIADGETLEATAWIND